MRKGKRGWMDEHSRGEEREVVRKWVREIELWARN